LGDLGSSPALLVRSAINYGQIFLGTPHRFQSTKDAEDQLCKLILLPGPEVKDDIPTKAKELARQVIGINRRFLATKIPDRAVIFNLFTQDITASQERPAPYLDDNTIEATGQTPNDDGQGNEATTRPVTPFPRYAHLLGHSFEASGRFRLENVDHLDLIRGEPNGDWFSWISTLFHVPGARK
jgi:hypothetical protein